jgi:hypothetical protein
MAQVVKYLPSKFKANPNTDKKISKIKSKKNKYPRGYRTRTNSEREKCELSCCIYQVENIFIVMFLSN